VPRSRDADVVIVVNPNNPTGGCSRRRPGSRQGLLVVDESFIDFLPREMSLAGDLPPARWCCGRSARATAWPACGWAFAIASPDIAVRLRAELGPWAVSGPRSRSAAWP
jgi:cobalamin biosynthetic protein CobC